MKLLMKLSISLTCCLLGSSGYSQDKGLATLNNTSWVQQGYGRKLQLADSNYTYLNFDNFGCKVLVKGEFDGRFRVVSYNGSSLVLNPGGIVNYIFKPLKTPDTLCTKSRTDKGSQEENFEIFWQTFRDNYAFFKERNVNWENVYRKYSPLVKGMSTDAELAAILREIVDNIKDDHIRLEIPIPRPQQPLATNKKTSRSKNEILTDLEKNYLISSKSYNNGTIKWGILKDNTTGYIVITDMNNFASYAPELSNDPAKFNAQYEKIKDSKTPLKQFDDELQGVDQVMKLILADLYKTSSIVIDLRFNGGGYETVALKLLSYFINEPKSVLSIQAKAPNGFTPLQKYVLKPDSNATNKKVYLLTSHNTASAAEIFALAAMSYKNIVKIGSPTAGIFSEILWKELPNGWEFSLSNEVYRNSRGKSFEGTGIPVQYNMAYPLDRASFYDSFYTEKLFSDRALERILKTK